MRYRIKVIPKINPNDQGEWLDIDVKKPLPIGWLETEKALADYVPDDHFLVQVERRTDGSV